MDEKWVAVYSTDQPYKAELLKQVLSDNSIQAMVMNQRDSFYHFGDIEICVQQKNVVRAKHILKKIEL